MDSKVAGSLGCVEAPITSAHHPDPIFEHMLDGFVYRRLVLDAQGKPFDFINIDCNQAFEKHSGQRREEMIGRSARELFAGREADIEEWLALYSRVVFTGEPIRQEKYAANLDRWFHIAIVRPEPMHFAMFFENITERKRVELRQTALVAELERKNAELEQFAYTVSHDLRSPLITIRSFAQSLAHDHAAGDHAYMATDLARIETAAVHMQALLDDLLELSRVGRTVTTRQVVSLNHVGAEVIELLQGPLTQRRVQVHIDPNLPLVHADPRRLGEVLQNLIENATRFMGEQPDPTIRVSARLEADHIRCQVTDNGIGIDARFQSQLFKPFHKIDPNTEGSGIGLALVQRVIKEHGGQVGCESAGTGRGSTFWFTLPPAP